MKLLFISDTLSSKSFGGAENSRRIYNSFAHILGGENIEVLGIEILPSSTLLQNLRKTLVKILFGRDFFQITLNEDYINQFEYIYLDSSMLGSIANHLHRLGYSGRVFTFFHNCMYSLYSQLYKGSKIKLMLQLQFTRKVESYCIRFSTDCIVLNERDKNEIKKIYGKEVTNISPICLPDELDENSLEKWQTIAAKPKFLFLGSYFAPNINGINWFIDNVYPYVEIDLTIVGKNMSQLPIKNSSIHLYSDVEDLGVFLNEADFMVFPLFEGSGMKVKTCTALMYGKNIIGTDEAFVGYDISNIDKIGAVCNSADDFISFIKQIESRKYFKFNEFSRSLYKSRYSMDASIESFQKIICHENID